MKRIGILLVTLAALLLLGSPVRAQQLDCNQTLLYDASTNGSTQLLTAQTGRSIYICGYTIVWGGTATVKLVNGTGTACATNEAAVTPAYSGVAQTVVSDSSSFWRGLVVTPGVNLCIKTSAGVAVQALVFYTTR